jgi:poly(beta-D-mannuronate) lyase
MNALVDPKPNEYFQVKKAIVKNNVIVDCKEAIAIGSGKDARRTLAPVNLVLTQNVIINAKKLINFYDEPIKSSIVSNRVLGGTLSNGFEKIKSDYIKKDNIYQLKGAEISPFWLTEKIGTSWVSEKLNFTIR